MQSTDVIEISSDAVKIFYRWQVIYIPANPNDPDCRFSEITRLIRYVTYNAKGEILDQQELQGFTSIPKSDSDNVPFEPGYSAKIIYRSKGVYLT
jgi:hypothetical protein